MNSKKLVSAAAALAASAALVPTALAGNPPPKPDAHPSANGKSVTRVRYFDTEGVDRKTGRVVPGVVFRCYVKIDGAKPRCVRKR